jgi:hypothetical protein
MNMSVINTITFEQIRFAAGLFEGVAIKLNRVRYVPDATLIREIVANTDSLAFALTTRNDLTSLSPTNLSVIDTVSIIGNGAGVEPTILPITSDFTSLPEGGLLLPANPLYLSMVSAGFAAAVGPLYAVLEYQWIRLSDREAIELLQTLIPGTV